MRSTMSERTIRLRVTRHNGILVPRIKPRQETTSTNHDQASWAGEFSTLTRKSELERDKPTRLARPNAYNLIMKCKHECVAMVLRADVVYSVQMNS